MFGRRAKLPIDIELRKAGPEEMLRKHLDAIPANEHDDFTRLQKVWQKRLEEVKANILAAQEKTKISLWQEMCLSRVLSGWCIGAQERFPLKEA